MTTMMDQVFKCSVCGAENVFPVLSSTNEFGSPDLDLRPAPMRRWTMDTWVQECPECGYVSGTVTHPTSVSMEYLQSDEYRTTDGIHFKSLLAKRFYKSMKISLKDGNISNALYELMNAAWACDDEKDSENAVLCRKAAIPLITEMIKTKEEKENLKLIKADLLRRSGCFEQLLDEYKDTVFTQELMNKILAFQIAKAKERDSGCYNVAQVMKAE